MSYFNSGLDKKCGGVDCVTLHERQHIKDALRHSTFDFCTTPSAKATEGYQIFMQQGIRRDSEISAYLIELECLRAKKAEPNTDCDCRDYLQGRIDRISSGFGGL